MTELLEHRRGGTSSGETEIHAIYQIGKQEKSIYNHKYPPYHPVKAFPFLPMERKQEQKNKQSITVKNGCRIENGTGTKQTAHISPFKLFTKQTPVCQQECQAADKIAHIDKQ
jgi:hypothetical protein